MLIIDTHAHAYAHDDGRYPPIENPTRPPDGAGSFSHLRRIMQENHVANVCVIQPGSFYRWDNRFICDVAAANRELAAGVCALDPENGQSPALLLQYVEKFGIRGLRSYAASSGALDHAGVRALWKAAGEAGIVVSIFIGRDKTDELIRLLERFPDQPVVIDHCLLPKAGSDLDSTVGDMLRLARFRCTYAKLSFIPMGSSETYPFRDMHEPCRKIMNAFTPGRCVWGSNFPSELWTPKATYAQHLNLFLKELKLSSGEKKAIMGETARQLWFSRRRLVTS
jgi:predicted TIM-barrel fold metal-dependent hydrolase